MTAQVSQRAVVDRVRVGAPVRRESDLALQAHPDKAISQRATILAALAGGTSRMRNLAPCRDVRANLAAVTRLGVAVDFSGGDRAVVEGVDGRSLRSRSALLDTGNSATTSRLLIAALAGGSSDCVVTGNESLRSRPMGDVVDPLRLLGADLEFLQDPGRLPLRVSGRRLTGGSVDVHVDSAQPVSAILMGALNAQGMVTIRRQTPARDHTERLLRWTGVAVEETAHVVVVTPGRPAPFDLTVPGDPSGAALLAAMHLAAPGGDKTLRIDDVCLNERRLGFFSILRRMGVDVTTQRLPGSDAIPEDVGTISVRRSGPWVGGVVQGPQLIQSCIDELPMVAALATQADGETVIRDAGEMRSKDTDRIRQTLRLLHAYGADAAELPDGLVIRASRLRAPDRVALPADHRIVFAAVVLSLLAGPGTELHGIDAAATSHPGALLDFTRFLDLEACT